MKVKDLLERKGIEVVRDGGYYFKCIYKGNQIQLLRNDGCLNNCYSLYINDKTIMTKALLTTCIGKILNLKEIGER